jgi:hypothetical protein
MFRTPTGPAKVDDRTALRRAQRARAAAGLTELDRDALEFGRFDTVTHDGDRYRIVRGSVVDARYTSAVAFYRTADGADVIFVEPLP